MLSFHLRSKDDFTFREMGSHNSKWQVKGWNFGEEGDEMYETKPATRSHRFKKRTKEKKEKDVIDIIAPVQFSAK